MRWALGGGRGPSCIGKGYYTYSPSSVNDSWKPLLGNSPAAEEGGFNVKWKLLLLHHLCRGRGKRVNLGCTKCKVYCPIAILLSCQVEDSILSFHLNQAAKEWSWGINSWPRQTVKVQASAKVQPFLRLLYGNLPKITGTIKRGNVCRGYANTLWVFCAGWVEEYSRGKETRTVCL